MKQDNNKVLLLDIINTNPKFAFESNHNDCSIMREMIIKEFYNNEGSDNQEIVIQNNSGFLVIEEDEKKYSLSSNLFINCAPFKGESMVLIFSELIKSIWENMKEYYNKNGFFNPEDLEFYNYIDGEYSHLFFQKITFVKDNKGKYIEGILFISNCVIDKDKSKEFIIHTGFNILDCLQNIMEILDLHSIHGENIKQKIKVKDKISVECFKKIQFELKKGLFSILKITNKNYKELFESFIQTNQDDIMKSYYYNNIPEPFKNLISTSKHSTYVKDYMIDFQHANKTFYNDEYIFRKKLDSFKDSAQNNIDIPEIILEPIQEAEIPEQPQFFNFREEGNDLPF